MIFNWARLNQIIIMIVRTIALIPKIRIKGPSKLQVPAYGLSGSKYSKQTSREIEQ